MPMRQETKRALLRELEDRGVQLDLEDDGRDATAKDVIRALKKAAHKKKNKISSSFEGSDCEEDKDSGKNICCDEEDEKGSAGAVVCRFLWALVVGSFAVAMVAVGAKKKDDCPAERMVPVFLIVNGAGFLFDVLLQMVGCVSMVHAVAKGRGFKGTFLRRPPVRAVRGILGFFLFVWFIVGSVYVFKIFEPNYDPDSVDAETSSSSTDDDVSSSSSSGGHGYCDEPMYKFAFSLLLIGYIILAIALVFSCCGCCVAGCMACALAAGAMAGGLIGGVAGGITSFVASDKFNHGRKSNSSKGIEYEGGDDDGEEPAGGGKEVVAVSASTDKIIREEEMADGV